MNTPKPRRDLALVLAVIGLAGGIALAAATAPHPNCADGDGTCKLQKIYAAQATKVVGGLLVGFLIGEYFFVVLPKRRLKAQHDVETRERLKASGYVRPEAGPEIDPIEVRRLLYKVNDGVGLPPAALRAAQNAPPAKTRRTAPLTDEQRKTLKTMSVPLGSDSRGTPDHPKSMRDVLLAQLDEPTGLPPAALEAARAAGAR
jgi:hypothetical protein